MNERIYDAIARAGFAFDKSGNWCGGNPEKLAEMMVRESIDVVQQRYMGDNNREDMEVRRCVRDLKAKLGVG
jgi:hypothetical protein